MEISLIKKEGIITNNKKVEYLSEYLDLIEEIKVLWLVEDKVWFRGVPDFSFSLIPSIYRKELWKYSQEKARWFFGEFNRKAKAFLDNKKSLWELYQLMQHYGAPAPARFAACGFNSINKK